MRMEADMAELQRQNQYLCEMVKQVLCSITVYDLRSKTPSVDFFPDGYNSPGVDLPSSCQARAQSTRGGHEPPQTLEQ